MRCGTFLSIQYTGHEADLDTLCFACVCGLGAASIPRPGRECLQRSLVRRVERQAGTGYRGPGRRHAPVAAPRGSGEVEPVWKSREADIEPTGRAGPADARPL